MNSILVIVFAPLLAAIVVGFGNRSIGNVPAKLVTTGALFLSCILSWPIFIHYLGGNGQATVTPVLHWISSGDIAVDWALRVDTLTAVMLVVVTTVSSFVHLYSWGYMDEDPDQPRFFAYLSLFTFAMLMLVTADNLVQMFFGWEGVGLASYLLIGFWFRKPSANAAAIKAFVVNRVGDFGFMLGIFGTILVFRTVSIPEVLAAAPGMAGSTIGFLWFRADTMTVLCVLLFIGAMGKSAQIGLHTWLPDAMEGPTPVSALIHAATMVTAGVFMVCRLSPMFETSHAALTFVTFIGAVTCFGAVDPVWGDAWALERHIAACALADVRIGVGEAVFWSDCEAGIAEAVEQALGELTRAGARLKQTALPEAAKANAVFHEGGVSAVELRAFLESELPGWLEVLDPINAAVMASMTASAAV